MLFGYFIYYLTYEKMIKSNDNFPKKLENYCSFMKHIFI